MFNYNQYILNKTFVKIYALSFYHNIPCQFVTFVYYGTFFVLLAA